MKISLGPIYFYWPKQKVYEFYQDIARSSVDVVYLGEVVCAKRHEMQLSDWLEIARLLTEAGKEVVLSTLTLIEADSELKRLSRICDNAQFLVEANDFAAINLLSKQQKPFAIGPSVNIYNSASLNFLAKKGLRRWCFPVELSVDTLAQIMQEKTDDLEVEVFAFGKLPLAFSARCFTARAYNLDKDNCQYKCIEHEQGVLLSTKEQQSFLLMNGIQTLSSDTFNLIAQLDRMQDMGVDVVRISPQTENTREIVELFKAKAAGDISTNQATQQLDALIDDNQCDGYWFEQAGMGQIEIATAP